MDMSMYHLLEVRSGESVRERHAWAARERLVREVTLPRRVFPMGLVGIVRAVVDRLSPRQAHERRRSARVATA